VIPALFSRLPWRYIGGAIAIIALGLLLWRAPWAENRGFHKRDAEVAALNDTITNMKAASAASKAKNDAYVAAKNAKNARIQKEAEDAVTQSSADARAAVRDYILRHPAQAAAGNASGGIAPGSTPAPGATAGAGQMSVVDAEDLLACTDAVVVAVGWQEWWSKLGK